MSSILIATDNHERSWDNCLCCYSSSDGKNRRSLQVPRRKDLVFILKKVLQLPTNITEQFVKTSAKSSSHEADQLSSSLEEQLLSPTRDVRLCEMCMVEIEKAKAIYEQLVLAVQQFRKIQDRLVDKIKGGYIGPPSDGNVGNNCAVNLTDKCRRFVVEYCYDGSRPFYVEDNEAASSKEESQLGSLVSHVELLPGDFLDLKVEDFESSLKPEGDDDLANPEDFLEQCSNLTKSRNPSNKVKRKHATCKTGPKIKIIRLTKRFKDAPQNLLENQNVKLENEVEIKDEKTSSGAGGMEDDSNYSDGRSDQESEKEWEPEVDQLIFQCTKCPLSFPKKRSLANHTSQKHRDRKKANKRKPVTTSGSSKGKLKCPEEGCGRSFKKPYLLREHISRHANEPMFKCKLCDEEFFQQSSLSTHERKYHPESVNPKPEKESFACDLCPKVCRTKAAISNHKKLVHNVLPSNDQMCPEEGCGKIFNKYEKLRDHLSIHHGYEPSHKCPQCDQMFRTWKQKWRHEHKVHQGGLATTPFMCEQCGKGYACLEYLTAHKWKVHRTSTQILDTGNAPPSAPVICEQCGKSLKNNACLYIHKMVVHRKDKLKAACHLCEKRYICQRQLKEHLFHCHQIGPEENRRKLQLPPTGPIFQCPVKGCRLKFTKDKSKLERHMRQIHGEDGNKSPEFKCRFCGKEFFKGYRLKYHELTHENKDTKPFICDICQKGFSTIVNLKFHRKITHKIESTRKNARRIENGCSNNNGTSSQIKSTTKVE